MPQQGEMYRAGHSSPGARLLAAAAFARPGHTAADIGCDHGKLAVYLAGKESCPGVIAVDSRPLPLARARALAQKAGLEGKVDCRLGHGLEPLAPHEAADIFIAGLSGETMMEIIAAAPWLAEAPARLILLPSGKAHRLRRGLCEAGFETLQEQAVAENGRYYSVHLVRYTGQAHSPSELYCQVGDMPALATNAARGVIAARLEDLQNQTQAPMPEEERAALEALIQEVRQWLV